MGNKSHKTFIKQANSSKWQNKRDRQYYALTLADTDLPLHPAFSIKFIQSFKKINNCTYKNRSNEYFSSIISWYKKHHLIDKEQVLKKQMFVQCPSICNLIACSIMSYTQQNDNILIMTPVYGYYITAIQSLNRNVIANQLKENKINKIINNKQIQLYSYQFDKKLFIQQMNQFKPKMILLCHPHNPTGKIFTKEQIEIIIQEAKKIGTYILSDEIMGDFNINLNKQNKNNKNNKFISLVNYFKAYNKIIVGNSISKVFNFQSIQGGYGIISSSQAKAKYQKYSSKIIKLLTNQMSIIFTPIIYSKDGQRWINYINKIIQKNNYLLENLISNVKKNKSFKIKLYNLESGFLSMIEFQQLNKIQNFNKTLHKKRNIKQILKQFGIQFLDMQGYYFPKTQRNLFRLAIAIHPIQFLKFTKKFNQCMNYLIKDQELIQPKL